MFSDTSDTSNAGTIECFVKKKKGQKLYIRLLISCYMLMFCIAMLSLLETKLVEEEFC